MISDDEDRFKVLMGLICTTYDKKCTPEILRAYWMMLKPYSIESVERSGYEHMRNTANGQFFPKPADFIRHIEGSGITHDEVIAEARLARTPFGILARIHIGTWDLNNQDPFYLKQRAEEVVQLLPEWRTRSQQGEYSDHEISIMLKHGVSPASPFAFGLGAPSCAQELAGRAKDIAATQRHKYLLEKPHNATDEPDGDNAAKKNYTPSIMKLVKEITDQKPKSKLWGDLTK